MQSSTRQVRSALAHLDWNLSMPMQSPWHSVGISGCSQRGCSWATTATAAALVLVLALS